MVVAAVAYCLNKFKAKEITLNYLVSGHTQNENDNAHSVIESGTKDAMIYTTEQWEAAIPVAFKKNKCTMERLFFDDVINFKSTEAFPLFAPLLANPCRVVVDNSSNKPVKWSKLMKVKFSKDELTRIYFKYTYSAKEYQSAVITGTSGRRKSKNKAMLFNAQKMKLYKKPQG